jgi:hypothetical protein
MSFYADRRTYNNKVCLFKVIYGTLKRTGCHYPKPDPFCTLFRYGQAQTAARYFLNFYLTDEQVNITPTDLLNFRSLK